MNVIFQAVFITWIALRFIVSIGMLGQNYWICRMDKETNKVVTATKLKADRQIVFLVAEACCLYLGFFA